jgi:hypothetical protein
MSGEVDVVLLKGREDAVYADRMLTPKRITNQDINL